VRRAIALFIMLCLISGGALALSTPPAAAEPPHIGGFGIEYAPKGKNGAVVLPWMGCDGSGTNVADIVNTATSKSIRRTWAFGMSYVSVPPGTYRVSIKATCNGASSSYTGVRSVKREADKNTITKSEFKRIKKGMSAAKVKKIVGNSGLSFGPVRLLDHRGNFGWAELTMKRGKVAAKWWHAELGDNSVR
jgi:hypothetical protein